MIQKRQVWLRSLQGGIQFPRVFDVRNPLVWLAIYHRQRSKRKGRWTLLTKRNLASHAAGIMYGRYAYLAKIRDFLVQDEDADDITVEATRRIERDRLTRLGLGDRT